MYVSSQGLNFLGLTAKKYNMEEVSNKTLDAVYDKLESFGQISAELANTSVALDKLKAINCKAYCVVDGEKHPITEKSWDRGGILEGKAPLEEGIEKGLYHIENNASAKINPQIKEEEDLDKILNDLKAKVEIAAQAVENQENKALENGSFFGNQSDKSFEDKNMPHKKAKKKSDNKNGNSLKFVS